MSGNSRLPTALRSSQLCWRYPHHCFPSFFAKFSHHITTCHHHFMMGNISITIDVSIWWWEIMMVYSPILSQKQSQKQSSIRVAIAVGWDIVGKSQNLHLLCRIWGETGAGQSGSARLRPSLPRLMMIHGVGRGTHKWNFIGSPARLKRTNWGLWPWTEGQNHDFIDPRNRGVLGSAQCWSDNAFVSICICQTLLLTAQKNVDDLLAKVLCVCFRANGFFRNLLNVFPWPRQPLCKDLWPLLAPS